MASVIDIVTGELGATLTYSSRRYCWVPTEPATAPDNRIGTLTLVCQKGKRGRASDDVDSYGVQEDGETDYPPGVRGFYLKNDTDPIQDEVYLVVVGTDAGGQVHERCRCKAFLCKVPQPCKHRDAMNKLIEDGVL